MGAMKNDAQKKKDDRRKIAVGRRRQAVEKRELFQVIEVDEFCHLIQTCLYEGVAVILTTSRDGGAWGLKLLHDDLDAETLWFADYPAWQEACTDVSEALTALKALE